MYWVEQSQASHPATDQYRSLTYSRAAHVTDVVGLRNIKPRIVHSGRASNGLTLGCLFQPSSS